MEEDIKILGEFIEEYNVSYPDEKEWVVIYPNQIQAIENLIARNKELEKKNRFLEKHEYTSKCECCKEEFYHKRPNVLWCKKCRTKMYNINYYANLSQEKRKRKAEKSKIAMRKMRKQRAKELLED